MIQKLLHNDVKLDLKRIVIIDNSGVESLSLVNPSSLTLRYELTNLSLEILTIEACQCRRAW